MEYPVSSYHLLYTDEEWNPIMAELARHGSPTAADRGTLEIAAIEYQMLHGLADSTSEEFRIAAACEKEIALHSCKLIDALDRLDSLRKRPSRLSPITHAMDPVTPGASFNTWKQQTLAMMTVAAAPSPLKPIFEKCSNRSRSAVLNRYLGYLLDFWIARGGHAGKSPHSPAVRFILAAARPIIPTLKASTVSHFIRSKEQLPAL
jgi:hypothetical protein